MWGGGKRRRRCGWENTPRGERRRQMQKGNRHFEMEEDAERGEASRDSERERQKERKIK